MQNVINGERVSTSSHMTLKSPHDLSQTLGTIHMADGALATKAIDNALSVKRGWMEMSIEDRGAIILKAADLLTGPYRARMNAATMMGQSKTAHQAEIDSACELADFWRFNVHFAKQMTKDQPYSPAGMWNQVDYRPLDGFVFAVSPLTLPRLPRTFRPRQLCLAMSFSGSLHRRRRIQRMLSSRFLKKPECHRVSSICFMVMDRRSVRLHSSTLSSAVFTLRDQPQRFR